MAVFHFRLASVLRFRQRVKEEKQWEVKALNEACVNLQNAIAGMEQALVGARAEMEGQEGQILLASNLGLHAEYCRSLTRRIDEKQKLLASVQKKLTEQREELIEADRAVKSLEQLRRRFQEKFRRLETLEEQKLADEMSQRKFSHRGDRQKFP